MWIWGPGCIWGAGARVGRPGGPDMAMLTTGLMLVMAALAIDWLMLSWSRMMRFFC